MMTDDDVRAWLLELLIELDRLARAGLLPPLPLDGADRETVIPHLPSVVRH